MPHDFTKGTTCTICGCSRDAVKRFGWACLDGKPSTAKKSVWKKDVFKELIPEMRERFRKNNIVLTKEQEEKIAQQLHEVITYRARLGFFGKTGSGKSSLCNTLFGDDVAKISDIAACTRSPQEYLLQLAQEKDIILVDVPGVGESIKRDDEYFTLYKSLAPNLDAILWIIKADDRAFTTDEKCWKELVRPYIEQDAPVIIVINQVDKFNPLKEWDDEANMPGPQQLISMQEKVAEVARAFSVPQDRVIPVSALRGFNIPHLVETVILSLPAQKKIAVLKDIPEKQQTQKAKDDAKNGFFETAQRILGDIVRGTGKVVVEVWDAVKPYAGRIFIEILKLWGKKRR